ncbi:DUF1579 domain-containing protein [Mesorhizobium qingshengii]|uniref:DUF1579 domain-containing protein n=1 Tax=Mesorhizobium qingshengii TaxID=1165689 RepID=A0ABT4QSN2_9HYPH|nr:DUF1579 domain-containing protein [Mesorhizobium qingshengii]MCZ8544374.1 DUF1579 domain-containing protein [Mesorhizobium qingshengii]
MPTQSTASHVNDVAVDGRGDFDFFFGNWNVSHRRLQRRLAGDGNWDALGGTCAVRSLLGGLGNVDDNVIELPGGAYRAATVRTFDPATRQWSIWWIDGRTPLAIDVPMRGTFTDGVGTFLCEDVFDNRPIRVRFLWSGITQDTARWEQAFSADGGTSWETNWVMDFARQT